MTLKQVTPIVVVGVSGATWDVLTPLIACGKTPHIAALLKRGVGARLASVKAANDKHFRPQSAWASIATGRLPDDHGMTRFFHEADEIRTPTLWSLFAQEGLASGVFGWPGTWPPPNIPGFVVPSHLARDDRTWPPSLRPLKALERKQQLIDREGGSLGRTISAPLGMATLAKYGLSFETAVRLARVAPAALFGNIGRRRLLLREAKLHATADLFLRLFQHYRPHFAAFVTFYVDFASHRYWRYREPQLFDPADADNKRFGDAIDRSYIALDNIVGRIVSEAPSTAVIVFLSEHGMGPELWPAEVGHWYYSIRGSRIGSLIDLGETIQPVPIARWIAFRPVPLDKRSKIVKALQEIAVVETGLPLLRVTEHGEEVIIKFALDAHVPVYAKGELESLNIRFRERIVPFSYIAKRSGRTRSAMHNQDGVFIISGPNICSGVWLSDASIVDIAPTLLAVAGLQLKIQFDGKLLSVCKR